MKKMFSFLRSLALILYLVLQYVIGYAPTNGHIAGILNGSDAANSEFFTLETFSTMKTDYSRTTSTLDTNLRTSTVESKERTQTQPKSTSVPTVPSTHSATYFNSFELCTEFSTCDHIANLTIKHCNCDELCEIYEDCCPNFHPTMEQYENYQGSIGDHHNKNMTCSPYSNNPNDAVGIFMIKTCPENYHDAAVSLNCGIEDIEAVGPFVIGKNNIVYQNRYCAECHGVDNFQPFSVNFSNIWSILMMFTNNNTVYNFDLIMLYAREPKKTFAVVEQIPPEGTFPRYCIVFKEGTNNGHECQTHSVFPVTSIATVFGLTIYRNKYCVPSLNTKCLIDTSDYKNSGNLLYNVYPLSIMFTFSQKDNCENQAYGFCLSDEIYEKYAFEIHMTLFPNIFLSNDHALKLLAILLWPLRHDVKFNEVTIGRNQEENFLFATQYMISAVITKPMIHSEMLEYHKKLVNCQWNVRGNFINDNWLEAYTHSGEDDSMKWNASRFSLTNYMLNTNINCNNYYYVETVCEQYDMYIHTNKSSNESIFTLHVRCPQEDKPNAHPTSQGNNGLFLLIITYVGMGMSVIGLTASIIMQRKLDLTNNIPGSNVEHLSIALLISTVVFIVGIGANDNQIVCYCIGVALHYLWLVVFAFKSIALIYMCYNIASMTVKETVDKSSMTKRKSLLTILGLSLPLLFIVPPIILDNLNVSGIDPEYDGSVCFPTGFLANVLFVSIPIGIAILINICCLIIIAVVITKQSLATRHIRKTVSFRFVTVYVRISVVTGIFWITGILGGFFPNVFFEYLFVIVCSFQGIFIAVANMTTKQVMQKLRNKTPK